MYNMDGFGLEASCRNRSVFYKFSSSPKIAVASSHPASQTLVVGLARPWRGHNVDLMNVPIPW